MRARVAAPVCLLLFLFASPALSQTLRIYHIDVDQASATLFVAPSGKSLLVDAGKNGHGARLRAAMQAAGVTQIDFFVNTHYHEDHLGGIDDLVHASVTVAKAFDRGDKCCVSTKTKNTGAYKDYLLVLGNAAEALTRGKTIPLDPLMTVTSIAAGGAVLGETNPPQPGQDENDMSVSLLITFAGFRYFIGGDTETATETKIAARDLVTDVDMYVADHHGAENGSAQGLLDDMKPNVVIISNGNRADYKHPQQSMLNRTGALVPAPVIFQTNKYLHTGDDGGNVADEFIADLEAVDDDGTILVTVDAAAGNYQVAWRNQTRTFAVKHPAAPPAAPVAAAATLVIADLLPDPSGSDTQDEEVTLRNKGTAAVSLAGWFLRDESGRVWALASLGTLDVGEAKTIKRGGMAMSLNNDRDEIVLLDAAGHEQDRFSYTGSQVGVRISTGH
ncbi:MAG TPA: lamin tail domain-containing protein [Gemmatimonadales bacterium]|jgi:beta-lactamase superfamily II metal-dependent hydrolase|nr:lamin tail domain-containing protein [Gemmatimonadales bacterium]